MLYQNYQKKILRLSAFLSRVVKHMVLICVIAGAATVATIGVLAAKGTPGELTCPMEFTYGDALCFDGDAFLSSVTYQFRTEIDEEWTDTVPKLPGDYQVRSVGSSLFGGERYSDPVPFTILPRTVTVHVAESSLVFGDMPTICSDFVIEGDLFTCDQFLYGDMTASVTEITPIYSAIRITDEDGNDVSSGYSMEILPSTVSFRKRPLKVLVGNSSDVYDGTPLSFDQYEIAEGFTLGADDELVALFSEFTGPGAMCNAPNLTIYHWQDGVALNVTHQYDIEAVSGTLTIDKRPVYIQTADMAFTYTGHGIYTSLSLSAPPYSLSTTLPEDETPLAPGHSLQVVAYTDPTDVGTYENVYSIRITDADGNDVTDCYSVHLNPGTIRIDPAPLSVTISDRSWFYDGQSHDMEYTVSGLLDGHRYQSSDTFSITDVGTLTIDTIDLQLTDRLGNSVTDNYAISFTSGTLTVEKRPISITTGSYNWVYDGEDHHWEGYQLSDDLPLADGQQLQVLNSTTVNSATETPVDNVLDFQIIDGNGTDRTENYAVIRQYGTLTVNQRTVSILTNSAEWVYDGQSHSDTGYTCQEGTSLVTGHTLVPGTHTTITNVSSTQNQFSDIKIMTGNTDVTDNYDLRITYGTLTVTSRPLTIAVNDATKPYDGEALTPSGWHIAEGTLATGHTFSGDTEVRYTGSQTEPGNSSSEIDKDKSNFTIIDSSGEDVSKNYTISCAMGKLTVTKIEITISSESATKIYDGTPLTHEVTHYKITNAETATLPDGHILVTSDFNSVTEPGNGKAYSVNNSFRYSIVKDGEDVERYYTVKLVYGTLTVEPIEITITSDDASKTYDGTALTNPECRYTVTKGEIPSAHTVSIKTTGSITNVGTQENTIEFSVEYNGNDVTRCFKVTKDPGTLTIDPRPITIITKGNEWKYDGKAHTEKAITGVDNLVGDHSCSYEIIGTITDVGTVDNEVDNVTITANGSDVTRNYAISYNLGKLIVTTKSITVETGSETWTYDGAAHSNTDYTDTGLLSGHKLTVTSSTTIADCGSKDNELLSYQIIDASGNDVTKNYNIDWTYGKLTVTARSVTIKTGSQTWQYDGKSHSYTGYTDQKTPNALVSGHKLTVTSSTTIKDSGTELNEFKTYQIIDANGKDVTDNYNINWECGTLKVIETTDSTVFGQINNDRDDTLYLPWHSYGAYDGKNWSDVASYGSSLSNGLSYAQMASLALQSNDIHVLYLNDLLFDLLPYYMDPESVFVKTSDDRIYYNLPTGEFSVIYYDMTTGSYPSLPAKFSAEEAQYRSFVYNTYLSIDEETRGFMDDIIAEQGFDKNATDIIDQVARYIQNAAEYSLEYGDLDNEENVVISFLRDYKKGKCTHYASAAAMLYRALGIPARYVEGFMVETKANEYVDIKNPGHAWVEVYIDGLGWVQVEVTGGTGNGNGNGGSGEGNGDTGNGDTGDTGNGNNNGDNNNGGNTEPSEEKVITVTLYPTTREYDGTTQSYPDYLWSAGSLPDGISLKLNISMTTPGKYTLKDLNEDPSKFAQVLCNGSDVTSEYSLTFTCPGEYDPDYAPLTVTKRTINIRTGSASKTYDGDPLSNSTVTCNASALVSGHQLIAYADGTITEPGTVENRLAHICIYDSYGNNVTEYYDFNIIQGTLTVYPQQD